MSDGGAVDRAHGMVRAYLDHLEDHGYVREVVDLLGPDGVLALLAGMVAGGDADEVADATLFVRDAVLVVRPPGFRSAYGRSPLVRALRHGVLARSSPVRAACVYTLGKTCHRPGARLLHEAFPWYLEHAPLELDGLLGELAWLGGAGVPYVCYLRRMVAAPLFLTRWAVLAEVPADRWSRRRSGLQPLEKQLLRRLAQDRHPWVRDEARWELDDRRAGPPHRGRQAYLQRRGAGRPALTFDLLATGVRNYLHASGERDYDAALCTAVGHHLQAHPVVPGYDPLEYWRPLAESRRSGAPLG